MAGQETEVEAGVGIVLLVLKVVVALAKGAKVDDEKAEVRTAVPGKATVEVLKTVVVELAAMDEIFNGTDTLRGRVLGAVVRGPGSLVVVFRGNEMLPREELTAVVLGSAILDKFDEAEGSAAEGDEVADARIELGIALEIAGMLGGAGI